MKIKELIDQENKEIVIQGFVDNIRNLQYVQFVILRDKFDKVQITIEKEDENNKELVKIIDTLPLESTIKVTGKVVKNEKVKLNGLEIIPSKIEVTSTSDVELPIDLKNKDNTLRETRLDYRYLDLRRVENQLLFKCQSYIEQMMREYWYNNDYTEIHTPKISASSAESGAEMFKLDYFGQQACLSQSPQFYKQMTMASGFDKIFEIGPVFRAENSHTSYHATEIEMIDVEISWINSVEDVMKEEENWIKYFISKLKEKYNSDFVFITNFPYSARSFYVMKDEKGETQTYDLLFKGLEITSGAQREHRYDILKKQIIEKGIEPSLLQFYLDFFKYGCPPHGGFGVGMGRILMQIFEIDNIREATLIYRGPTRLNP